MDEEAMTDEEVKKAAEWAARLKREMALTRPSVRAGLYKRFEAELEKVRAIARSKHEADRKAAAKRGRKDYPNFPYECSWAFEEEFRRKFPDSMAREDRSAFWPLRDMPARVVIGSTTSLDPATTIDTYPAGTTDAKES